MDPKKVCQRWSPRYALVCVRLEFRAERRLPYCILSSKLLSLCATLEQYFKQVTSASFQILPNAPFSSHPIIRRRIISISEASLNNLLKIRHCVMFSLLSLQRPVRQLSVREAQGQLRDAPHSAVRFSET
jgi:hypothetical protein